MNQKFVRMLIGLTGISVVLNVLLWFSWSFDSKINDQDVREACFASFHIGKLVAAGGTFPSRANIEKLPTRLVLEPKSGDNNSESYRIGMFGRKVLEFSIDSDQQFYVKLNKASKEGQQ